MTKTDKTEANKVHRKERHYKRMAKKARHRALWEERRGAIVMAARKLRRQMRLIKKKMLDPVEIIT